MIVLSQAQIVDLLVDKIRSAKDFREVNKTINPADPTALTRYSGTLWMEYGFSEIDPNAGCPDEEKVKVTITYCWDIVVEFETSIGSYRAYVEDTDTWRFGGSVSKSYVETFNTIFGRVLTEGKTRSPHIDEDIRAAELAAGWDSSP